MATTEETKKPATTRKSDAPEEMARNQRIVVLAAGDALCFLIFAAIGRGSHGEATGVGAIPQIVVTALPFAAGWFLVSPFLGAFRGDIVTQPRAMALRTTLAWLSGWPVALALRGIFVDHRVPPFSFATIVLFFNLGLLLIWRWPFAINNSLKKRNGGNNTSRVRASSHKGRS